MKPPPSYHAMKICQRSITACLAIMGFFVFCRLSFAGGAAQTLERQRGMQQQRQQMIEQQVQQRRAQEQAAGQEARQLSAPERPAAVQEDTVEVADLSDVVRALLEDSEAWTLIIDREAKVAVVDYFISQLADEGAVIRYPADRYVGMIDSMMQESPEMAAQPLKNIIRVIAVLEYDFDNGRNKDAMALQILGSREAVLENRKRLGL